MNNEYLVWFIHLIFIEELRNKSPICIVSMESRKNAFTWSNDRDVFELEIQLLLIFLKQYYYLYLKCLEYG